jgi:hypothetical protein
MGAFNDAQHMVSDADKVPEIKVMGHIFIV